MRYLPPGDVMFEAAELGVEVDKKTWKAESPKARETLLQAQHDLALSRYSCVVLVSGVEGAGKRETVNLLRAKWDAYALAACEMFERTGTKLAPWVIVEANDKLHTRLKVLRSVTDALSAAL